MPDFFHSVMTNDLTIGTYLLCTAIAFLCGIITALAAAVRSHASKSFLLSLVLLPAIVETVILMVNGNIGTGIAVAGAFSLVRFRSAAGKARDIALIFLVMTAGLACAAGYLAIAVLFTLIVSVILILIMLLPLHTDREMELRITVPETIHYTNAFDDLFHTYTKNCRLISVKTTNMGSLYRLSYRLELKRGCNSQELIDQLRYRNGNLEIALSYAPEKEGEL